MTKTYEVKWHMENGPAECNGALYLTAEDLPEATRVAAELCDIDFMSSAAGLSASDPRVEGGWVEPESLDLGDVSEEIRWIVDSITEDVDA